VKLPVPLAQIPGQIGGWVGQDKPIPDNIVAYMTQNFADDYVSRRYVNDKEGVRADLYVVYCSSRPEGILGHQPLVCFPGNGWIHDERVLADRLRVMSNQLPVHRFHNRAGLPQMVV
jgi:hypothetical protein